MPPTLRNAEFAPIKTLTLFNEESGCKMLTSSFPEFKVDALTPVNSPGTTGDEEDFSNLTQDINDILASFSTKKVSVAVGCKKQRRAPRFRVKWFADILTDGRTVSHGFVNDISSSGASIYLNSNLRMAKCMLRIHVPPLNLTSKPHMMEVSGKILYVVYDGDKQLFRVAINFSKFNPESDMASLDERLNKYHSKIPEY